MKGIILLLVLSLLWGSSFLWTKQLLLYFEPATLVFFRCVFGIMALFPFWLKSKQRVKFRITLPFLIIISLGAAIPWTIVSFSLISLDTGIAGVLNATTPMFGLLLSIWILRERPSGFQFIGILIGFLAVTILFLSSGQGSNEGFSYGHALFMLVATVCYALNSILVKKNYPTITAVQLGMWTLGMAALLNGIFSVIREPMAFMKIDAAPIIFSLLMLGCLGSGLGYYLFYRLVITASPVFALLTTFIIPFVTILLGVLILDEPVHLSIIIGLPLMIISLLIMNLKEKNLQGRVLVKE